MRNKKKIQDDFDTFEVEIPLLLEDLSALICQIKNTSLNIFDFSFENINLIEQFYLDILNKKIKSDISQDRLDRIFIAYLGESFRAHLGGQWTLELDKSSEAYGTPVISQWGDVPDKHINYCPIIIREWFKQEKGQGELQKTIEFALESDENYKNL